MQAFAYADTTEKCIDRVYGHVLNSFPNYDGTEISLKSGIDADIANFCLKYTPASFSTVDDYYGLSDYGKQEWDFFEMQNADIIFRENAINFLMSFTNIDPTIKELIGTYLTNTTNEKNLIQDALSTDEYITNTTSFVYKLNKAVGEQFLSYVTFSDNVLDNLNKNYTCDESACILTSSLQKIEPVIESTPVTSSNPIVMEPVFTDVMPTNKFYDAIKYLKDNDIVGGYTDGSYGPFNSINRAEFTKIIVGAVDPAPSGSDCFPDVNNEWFAPYVCYAKTNKIIEGYDDGTFKPDQYINLAEALKIVLLALKVDLSTNSGSNWYDVYLNTATNNSYLSNINSDVTHNISRGEMAELIYSIEQ